MSIIRPFKGLRPRPEYAAQVAAPPYDVLSSDEARELIKGNPISFLRVNKPEVDFPREHDATDHDVYENGKKNLQRLVDDGIMQRESKPCLYLYRLTWRGRSQTGLMALTSCDEYNRNIIKKHEHTRPAKVSDRADHIEITGAQVGPVFSIFHNNEEIKRLFARIMAKPAAIDFTATDEVRHELWVVSADNDVREFVAAFAKLPALYIADGHHRSAAAAEVARRRTAGNPHHTGDEHYNFFLNVIFPDDELRILPYNRVVRGLNGMSRDQLFACAAERFTISPANSAVEPTEPYEYGIYIGGAWYRMAAKPGSVTTANPAESIDSAILTTHFLTTYLGIKDIRTDDRIDFVGGIRGTGELERLVNSGNFDIAFSLRPATVGQLLSVADANTVMPPKSTWFEPKLRDGIVVSYLDE